MRVVVRLLIAALVLVAIGAAGAVAYVKTTGLRGQPSPGPLETRVARALRALAVPAEIKQRSNPLAASEEAMYLGLEHYAKYCAMCHANNGSGEKTAIGGGLFPKPPDLRAAATQDLTDGELFYIIENGVRFTGMPAFGTGEGNNPAGEQQVWQLVRFIRQLPRITADDLGRMEELNPL